jgi:DsbC/DsbD-like thiol-disulfide interchange protein
MALLMNGKHLWRPDRRLVLGGLGSLGLAVGWSAPIARAASPAASAWSEAPFSKVRLVRGASSGNGEHRAGIAFHMKQGFKTYWRHPGDSGVPPVFRFDGSQNLAEASVHFPAPKRFDDGAGGVSFGYAGPELILPVTARAKDPKEPVLLRLEIDYAVCEKMCVPASGKATLELRDDGRSPFDEALRTAMAAVPAMTTLAAGGPLRVMALRKGLAAEHFLVEALAPGGSKPELFVEGESPWFFEAKDFVRGTGNAPGTFQVLVVERDKSPDCTGAEITLTFVAGGEAIEVSTRLDMALIAS